MGTANKLKMADKFPIRGVSASDLFKINERSFHLFNYNQSLCPEFLAYIIRHIANARNQTPSRDTLILVGKVMVHNHKGGIECEPHIRTTIYFPKGERIGFPLIDVGLNDFDVLPLGDSIKRYGYPKHPLFPDMQEAEDKFDHLIALSDRELQSAFQPISPSISA
jgi:hypothetical protein